MILKRNLSY